MNKRKTDDEKGMHDGHRQRLMNVVFHSGLENVSDIQALEFILFYIIPRGDVNPLAHRLLDRFSDIPTVLEASVYDLQQVKGLGEKAAVKLKMLLEILYFYEHEKLITRANYRKKSEFYDHLEQLLRYRLVEQLYMFGVHQNGELTKPRCAAKGTTDRVQITTLDISLYVSTFNVKRMILVHNHPNGSCTPSLQDRNSYADLKKMAVFAGCEIEDSIIVGCDGIFSMASNAKERVFTRGPEYEELLQIEGIQEAKQKKESK